jgi:hypothetical protein
MSGTCNESRGAERQQSFCWFSTLPVDVQFLLLQYLSCDDLNEFASVSRSCRELRANHSLPQIRTGTINIGHEITIEELLALLAKDGSFNRAFQSPRNRLKLTNHFKIKTSWVPDIRRYVQQARLSGVTSLDVSFCPTDTDRFTATNLLMALTLVMPNLVELDMSYIKGRFISENIAKNCKKLETLRYNGTETGFYFTGRHCLEHFANLRELYLDGAHLRCMTNEPEMTAEGLFSHCNSKLERVSLKGTMTDTMGLKHRSRPLLDEELVEFVRTTPTLTWLRSDLSPENVAILQQERPMVHFVH